MRAAVFYATREGHTQRVTERVADGLRARNAGHHEPEMIAFVKLHRRELERLPAAFLSVSLSEAGAEDPRAPSDRRQQSAADVQKMIDVFVQETDWQPPWILPVAGAPTDTSRDYEFTDWPALDRFVEELVRAAQHQARVPQLM